MRHLIRFLALSLFLLPSVVEGQVAIPSPRQATPQLVDRVVAVVGDSAILYSQVLERLLEVEASMQNSGTAFPDDPEEIALFERGALDGLVTQSILLQAAVKDSVAADVPEERIEAAFEDAWAQRLDLYGGSEGQLRAAIESTGRTIAEFRANLRRDIQNELILQRFMQIQQQQTRVPPVDEADIRAYYEERRAEFETRPATITFKQVLLTPQPSDSAKTAARVEAERILGLLRDGDDFAELARRFSDDGSAAQGGELGWIQKDLTVPEFDAAVFSMSRGQTSGIVETQYGAHIIRVERIGTGERFVRHILIAATPNEADLEGARVKAQAIRDSIAAGEEIERFMAANAEVGMQEEITIQVDSLSRQLPAAYAQQLRTAPEGAVLGPISLVSAGQTVFAVLQVTEVRGAGVYTYEELRDPIREQLQSVRFEDRMLERLTAQTHVDVRW